MQTVLIVVNLLLALGVIGLVLLQHGKGADAGAAFGSGASATVFGAQGSANFLSRTTAILAAGWFATTLGLAWYAINASEEKSLMELESAPAPAPVEMPAPTSVIVPDIPDVPEAQTGSDVPVIGEAVQEQAAEQTESVAAPVETPADVPAIPE